VNSVKTDFELSADVGFIREKASATATALGEVISGVLCICHILTFSPLRGKTASGFDIFESDSPEGNATFIPALK
jgi:hypothetical protein